MKKKMSYRELERYNKKVRKALESTLFETTRELTKMLSTNEILESVLEQLAEGQRSKHEAALWFRKWQKTKQGEGVEMSGEELAEYLEVPDLKAQFTELERIAAEQVRDIYEYHFNELETA